MIWILVGTETGNSLDFAERASDELQRFGVENEVVLMDDLSLETFVNECKMVLFICSTTGDGESPLCMRSFVSFLLRADLPYDLLKGMRFGVFGLGDSSYEKFNFVGKRLWRRLPKLGAEALVPFRGEGDEQNPKEGLEHGWLQWWPQIKAKLCVNRIESFVTLPPKHKLLLEPSIVLPTVSTENFYQTNLLSNERMTPVSHFQDTRLLKFSIEATKTEFTFMPGDILALLPHNDIAAVDELLSLLQLDGSLLVHGIDSKTRVFWTTEVINFPITLRDFIMRFVDISAIPSRTCCRRMAQLVDMNAASYSEMHKEKLLELADDESEYLDYIWRPKRTILEVLRDFTPSVKVGLESILQVFKPLRRRQFSIASAPKYVNGRWELELCVALIEHELPGGRGKREGVISRCFRTNELLNKSAQVFQGSWNIACLSGVRSVLLFATGTGIAPIRHLIQSIKVYRPDLEVVLFYGCRSLEADFYFAEEWQDIKVFAGGSRDKPGKKVYLDSIIEEASDFLKKIDFSSTACFVAGHTRLNKLVSNCLSSIWGPEVVNQLKQINRYKTETWS